MNLALYNAIINSNLEEVASIVNDSETDVYLNEVFIGSHVASLTVKEENLTIDLDHPWTAIWKTTYLEVALATIQLWDEYSNRITSSEKKAQIEETVARQICLIELLLTYGAWIGSYHHTNLFFVPLHHYVGAAYSTEQFLHLTELLLRYTLFNFRLSRHVKVLDVLRRLKSNAFDITVPYFELLLKYGLDVNDYFGMGFTPLMLAIELSHPKLIKLMLDKRGDVFAKIDLIEYTRLIKPSPQQTLPQTAVDLIPKSGLSLLDAEIRLKREGYTSASIFRFAQTQYYHYLLKGSADEFNLQDNLGISDTLKEALIMREPEFEARFEEAGTDMAVSHHLEQNGIIAPFVDLIQAYRSHEHLGLNTLSEMKRGLFFQLKGPRVNKSIDKEQLKAEHQYRLNHS